MGKEALGLIETTGMLTMIALVDEMLKSANVLFVGCKNIDGNFTASVSGDLSSVSYAIEVGARKGRDVGEVLSCRVISSLETEIDDKLHIRSAGLALQNLGCPPDNITKVLLDDGS